MSRAHQQNLWAAFVRLAANLEFAAATPRQIVKRHRRSRCDVQTVESAREHRNLHSVMGDQRNVFGKSPSFIADYHGGLGTATELETINALRLIQIVESDNRRIVAGEFLTRNQGERIIR